MYRKDNHLSIYIIVYCIWLSLFQFSKKMSPSQRASLSGTSFTISNTPVSLLDARNGTTADWIAFRKGSIDGQVLKNSHDYKKVQIV